MPSLAHTNNHKSLLFWGLRFLNVCKGIIKTLVAFIVFLLALSYYQSIIYNFDEPERFSGNSFYNPYKEWNSGDVYKANFHAHSAAWSGLTNGHNTPEEILEHYKREGYKIAGLSNYHEIKRTSLKGLINLPMYEHGCNIRKTHKLAIGAKKVSYLDFPLWQNTSQKQLVINNIKKNDGLVAIAHPNNRDGHTLHDIKYLSDYDFIEVMSPSARAQQHWDMALKNGKVVWALSNDDTHDLIHEKPGRFYNVLANETKHVKKTLKEGHFYAVKSLRGKDQLSLEKIQVSQDSVYFSFNGAVKSIIAIINGKNFYTTHSKAGAFKIPSDAEYVRFEVNGTEDTLLSNPIIKSNGKLPINQSMFTANLTLTILFRLAILSTTFAVFWLLLGKKARKKFQQRLRVTVIRKIRLPKYRKTY